MSTQSQRSFTIRRAASNDGEAIVACLTAAFAPYSNSYTPAAFTDTVLDPRLVQDRLREMCVFSFSLDGEPAMLIRKTAAEGEDLTSHKE